MELYIKNLKRAYFAVVAYADLDDWQEFLSSIDVDFYYRNNTPVNYVMDNEL